MSRLISSTLLLGLSGCFLTSPCGECPEYGLIGGVFTALIEGEEPGLAEVTDDAVVIEYQDANGVTWQVVYEAD